MTPCRNTYCDCAPQACQRPGFWDARQPHYKPPQNTQLVQRLLDKLQEESAEVIQAISKIRRFGPHNHHPDRTTTNMQELVGELEDWLAIVHSLTELQYFDPKPEESRIAQKSQQLLGS